MRLICNRSFEDIISDTATMTLREFQKKLENIKVHDTALQKKLAALGVNEKKAHDEFEILIARKQQPVFSALAKMLEKGTYSTLRYDRAHPKIFKV